MKMSISFNEFQNEFKRMDRGNFSPEALKVLFAYLEQFEESTGVEMELDVIALCCDFEEMSYPDVASNYDVNIDGLDEDETISVIVKYLERNTIVLEALEDSVLFINF